MAPLIEPAVQINANLNAFFLAPKTRAINKTSGGIGKKDDSAKANIKRAIAPYGVYAQDKTQSYNFRMYFINIKLKIINKKNTDFLQDKE